MLRLCLLFAACVFCSASGCVDDDETLTSLYTSCSTAQDLCKNPTIAAICPYSCSPRDDDQGISDLAASENIDIDGCADVAQYCNHNYYGPYIQNFCFETCNCDSLPEDCGDDDFMLLHMYDSYGDGWNGAVLTVTDCEGNLVGEHSLGSGSEGTSTGCIPEQYQISVSQGSFPGEVSWTLVNHETGKSLSGGAGFEYSTCPTPPPCPADLMAATLQIEGSWFQAEATVADCDGNEILAWESELVVQGFEKLDLCLPQDYTVSVTNEFSLVGGDFPFDWKLIDGEGNHLLSGQAPYHGGSCGAPLCEEKCSDEEQEATLLMFGTGENGWDQSFLTITGCDGLELSGHTLESGEYFRKVDLCLPRDGVSVAVTAGFNPDVVSWAIVDNEDSVLFSGNAPHEQDTCATKCDEGLELAIIHMYDSAGDGWNAASLHVFDCDYNVIEEGITLLQGDFGTHEVCVPEGFRVSVSQGYSPVEVVWVIYAEIGTPLLSGYAPDEQSTCEDDGTATPTPQPTDEPPAVPDCDKGERLLTVHMYDAVGDGWNGSVLNMYDCKGRSFAGVTFHDGGYDYSHVCAPEDGFTVYVNGGPKPDEVSWIIADDMGYSVLQGGAPFDGTLCQR